MLNLKRVAVTGGISSGKSSVINFFQKLGAYIVSADQITHQFLSTNTAINKLVPLLGKEILSEGCIDRKKVAAAVFRDPILLGKLEAIIHPEVAIEIANRWRLAKKEEKYPLFVAEVPLLFEANQESFYDATCAVIADDEQCKVRFCNSTGASEEEYYQRAKRQLTQAEKANKAKFVIENMGSLEELEAKTKALFKILINEENA